MGDAVGCGAPGQDGPALLQGDPISQGLTSENGLTAVNGLSATNASSTSTAVSPTIHGTAYNMEFKNTVWSTATGRMSIEDVNGGRRLCSGHWGEHIVITKNSGEPFSLVNLKVGYRGENATLTIRGYTKGSTTVKTITVANPSISGTFVNVNWDNLLKVEMRGPQGNCIDDVVIKT